MPRSRQNPLWSITIVALMVLMVCSGCTRTGRNGETTLEELAAMPDQESWNAELRVTSGGRPSLIMRAPYMARFENRDSTYAALGPDPDGRDSSAVHVELFDNAGEPLAMLTADELTYFDRQRRFDGQGEVEAVLLRTGGARLTSDRLVYEEADGRFVASGNVLVISQDGKRLSAETVNWDADNKQLRVNGAFRFETQTERIRGVGLVASEDLSRYSFSSASGELEVQE